ncbi:MAG: hypothetical protein APF80_00460 [Alphaproteobacteria bacterium BRH_c36]|nr:MAG: hypothetical protein APF80_00460 [Alphaproteobacteria bacterium BRH_c36]
MNRPHHTNGGNWWPGWKRPLAAFLAVSCAALMAAGCATNLNNAANGANGLPAEAPAAQNKPVTIAMVLPLTGFGRAAIVGKSLKQAGELALFESGNPAVRLIVKNDDGNAGSAGTAAQEALAEGAEVIVGPLFGASVPAVSATARTTNTPVLALSNDRNVAGNGVYLISDLPESETERIVSYAIMRGKRRFAALIPTGAYGDTVERAFRTAVTRGGGVVVAAERFDASANAMLEPARRIFDLIKEAAQTGAPVDALFVPGNQDTLPTLGPQIAYANIDTATTQLMGLSGWEFPNIGREKVFVGGWYTGQDPAEWQAFSERFAQTFGQAPPRVAARAYEAVSLAISLSGKPKGQRFTQANLTVPAGFAGVNGRFSLKPDGTSERNLSILEVQTYGSHRIDDGTRAPGQSLLGHSPPGLTGTYSPLPPGQLPSDLQHRRPLPVQPVAGRTTYAVPL